MSDLIERNDAVEAIEFEKVYMTAYKGSSNGYVSEGNLFEKYNKGLDDAIKAINSIAPAEPEPKWIPVIEALPEICQKDVRGNVTFSKQVWSCQKYGDGFFWQSIDQYTTNNGGGWLSEVPHDDPNDCCKVVAWMPLPEPWRGEE